MTSPNTPPTGQPDPAALLALGLATQAADAGASSVPPLTPAELAAEFPQLEILELLGRGGMGAVYKARQRDLDRLVALKILRPGLDADPGFAERFTREARALAQLNHPGIVTLYEFGKTSAGRYFILMEFVDGMNLRQLLAAGRLSPREALAIVPPLCDALQYAHDRGLIHRDIKPENLLIDRLGRIKIADFGIARLTSEGRDDSSSRPSENAVSTLTSVGEVMGTPHYMAPEQHTHPNAIDHRADLYALGVVLYQMLTGELPAAGQLQPPSHRVQLDVRLDEIVLRALEKNPALRYSTATELKTQVQDFTTASAPVSASLPDTAIAPKSTTARPNKPRNPRLHFGLILFAALAVVIFFLTHHTTPRIAPVLAATETRYEPQELVALAWPEEINAGTGKPWSPTGEPIPDSLQLPPSVPVSLKPKSGVQNTARFITLWFSQKPFDSYGLVDVTFLDETGTQKSDELLAGFTSTLAPQHLQDPYPGWYALSFLARNPDTLPRQSIVRIRQSFGEWTRLENLNSTIEGSRWLNGNTFLTTPMEGRDGASYIYLTRDQSSKDYTEQFKFTAVAKDGRRLEAKISDSNSMPGVSSERHRLDVPLREVAHFECYKRPIQVTTRIIALRPQASPSPANAAMPQPVSSSKPSMQFLQEAGPVTLPELAAQIRALITRHFPAAEINESPDRFDARFATQEFPIYRQLTPGAVQELAYEETGPSETGFILMLTRLDQPYADAISLPDTGENPNWKTFTNAGFDETRSTGLLVQLMIGSKPPKAFHEELMRIIGMIHLPRRSLTSPSGETLFVYTQPFLDENDLAAVEKISVSEPSARLRLYLTEQGAFRLNQLSQLALGRRIAIMVNDQLVSAPKIMAELSGNEIEISGLKSAGDESALLASFPGPAPKTLTKATNQAIAWLQLLDTGRYVQSWQRSASIFRKAITEDQWIKQIESVRTPLGPLASRHLRSTQHLSTLPGAAGGPHLVMQFQARFAQKESAVETVTFTRDTDGEWRASGYFIK